MHWINTNINHLVVPLGILLGLFAAVNGWIAMEKRKAGATRPYINGKTMMGMVFALLICCVLFGIAVAHVHG